MSGNNRGSSFAFPRWAASIDRAGGSLVAFMAFSGLVVLGIWFMYEDFNTSVWGYELLPVNEGFPQTKYFVAALPILLQMSLVYLGIGAAVDKASRHYLMYIVPAFVVAWLIDSVPDIIYRSQEGGLSILTATLLTVFVFTLCTEVILSFFLSMNRALWHYFVKDLGAVFSETSAALGRRLDRMNNQVDNIIQNNNNRRNR